MPIDVLVDQTALEGALARVGWTWDALCSLADEIVLFGSQACGCAQEGSDWDILCVGNGRSRNTRRIDLLWASPKQVHTRAWQESELAGHVGTYGRWLHGSPSWAPRFSSDRSSAAAKAKARRIGTVSQVLEQFWDGYSAPYRHKYWTKLRRDLQRYALLRQGLPVPPSAWLDSAWEAEPALSGELVRIYRDACSPSLFFARIAAEMLGSSHQKAAAHQATAVDARWRVTL